MKQHDYEIQQAEGGKKENFALIIDGKSLKQYLPSKVI